MHILVFILLSFFLVSCSSKVSDLSEMSSDVIKHKEGVDIRITPVNPEDK